MQVAVWDEATLCACTVSGWCAVSAHLVVFTGMLARVLLLCVGITFELC